MYICMYVCVDLQALFDPMNPVWNASFQLNLIWICETTQHIISIQASCD